MQLLPCRQHQARLRVRSVIMALAIGGLLARPAAGTAEDNGPPYPVIALHLEVTQSKSPPPPVPEEFACDDSQINSALLNVTTSQKSANVYVIALDVPSDVGLKTAAFGIEANSSEFYVQWESYASSQQPTPQWPDPGSGNRLTFDTCQGTVPDPTDPEGDGFVVLGKFYLYAYSEPATFHIAATDAAPVEITDCAGKTRQINYRDPLYRICWGKVGFGRDVWEIPCGTGGSVEPPCVFGDYPELYVCCRGTTCLDQWPADVSERACANLGGTWTLVSCRYWLGCELACQPVPVLPITWGLLKARY